MRKAVDLTLVVRSGYASAVAALNHASAGITSIEAIAEHISSYLIATVADDSFLAGLSSQEIEAAVRNAIFSASATLDETNVWGITNDSEFAFDYQVFDDVLVAAITLALEDSFTTADSSFTSTDAAPQSDAFAQGDGTVSAIGAVAGDAINLAEAAVSDQSSNASDVQAYADVKSAAIESSFSEGLLRTYFAGDYALDDYNAIENHTADAASATTVAAPLADTSTNTDVSSAAIALTFADGTTYTYFAGDYALSDYGTTDNYIDDRYSATATASQADTTTVSDSSGAAWTFPAWADAAVPVDDIAIALTVASADTSTTSDSTSAVIQNYAIDPTYFGGDYATTAY